MLQASLLEISEMGHPCYPCHQARNIKSKSNRVHSYSCHILLKSKIFFFCLNLKKKKSHSLQLRLLPPTAAVLLAAGSPHSQAVRSQVGLTDAAAAVRHGDLSSCLQRQTEFCHNEALERTLTIKQTLVPTDSSDQTISSL